MNIRLLTAAAIISGVLISPALAQTPLPVLPGTLSISSCPGNIPPCYTPYSATNPMPVTVAGAATPDVNLAEVNGAAVNVGTGASGAGTQRVTTATDSTIATITNPVTVTDGAGSLNVIVDSGTVTTVSTVTAVTTLGTVTNPVGIKGADGSAIASATNPNNVVQSPTATQGLTTVTAGAAATNLVLKASAGNLVHASITIGATSGYVMIHNATSAPGDGAVTPLVCVPVLSNGTFGSASFDFGLPGKYFSTGITAVFSTTGCFTQTLATAAFLNGSVK